MGGGGEGAVGEKEGLPGTENVGLVFAKDGKPVSRLHHFILQQEQGHVSEWSSVLMNSLHIENQHEKRWPETFPLKCCSSMCKDCQQGYWKARKGAGKGN